MAGLKKKDQAQLSQWIGGRKRFTLLFKATRDGCCSSTFHRLCNNKGPTVTVLYNVDQFVYGGYASANWRSSGDYLQDENAFLFRLYQNGNFKPVRMSVQKSSKAIYDSDSYGPTFGGHDLHTFSHTIESNGGFFPLNGNTNFGNSYTMNNENYNSIAHGHLKVKDLHVYLVEDWPSGASLHEEWRVTPDWDEKLLDGLMADIRRYRPLICLNVLQTRLLLIGPVGAGKSSFFNTINSIFRGYITSQACSGNADHSLTTLYRMYQIRNGTCGKPMAFRMHDTRGIETDQGIDSHEICYLLDGNLPDSHQFNPSLPISKDLPGFVLNPQLSDKIHCVVFVLDGTTVDVIPDKILERMRSLQTSMNLRGIPQVVLLTKIERICATTNDDLSKVFYSPAIQEAVERVSQVMGLPRSHIFPVKNYESELDLNESVNILALMALKQILHFADDYQYNYLDQQWEGKVKEFNIWGPLLIACCVALVAILFSLFYKIALS